MNRLDFLFPLPFPRELLFSPFLFLPSFHLSLPPSFLPYHPPPYYFFSFLFFFSWIKKPCAQLRLLQWRSGHRRAPRPPQHCLGGAVGHALCLCGAQFLEAAAFVAKDSLGVGPSQQIAERPDPGGDLTVAERNREELCCQQQEVGEKWKMPLGSEMKCRWL